MLLLAHLRGLIMSLAFCVHRFVYETMSSCVYFKILILSMHSPLIIIDLKQFLN